MEPFLAIAHYLMIFATVALVLGEFVLLRLEATGQALALLGKIDMFYGIFALLVVATGLMRVFLGDVAPSVWGASHAFWTKMALFGVIGLLSAFPTLKYFAWRKAFAAQGTLPNQDDRKKASLVVALQLGLYLLMPVMAVLMAEAAEK